MGDQSCGKSSVLEALSGVSFPRGSGLVTRCPVQLVMKRTAAGSPWKARARVAWQKSTQPKSAGEVRSPELLEAVIAELMSAVCDATANGFSTDSLVIDISSPECPDLTLIDLPGIVRTAVAGQTTGVRYLPSFAISKTRLSLVVTALMQLSLQSRRLNVGQRAHVCIV
jgi:interferon-induced GTP-binding protein Mx